MSAITILTATTNSFPYYLFPESVYCVGVSQSPVRAKVSVGTNPWSPRERIHNLAKLCEQYGGGGHAVVAAISFKPDELERLAPRRKRSPASFSATCGSDHETDYDFLQTVWTRRPFFTYIFFGLNIVIFVLMTLAGGTTNESTLLAFGVKANVLIVKASAGDSLPRSSSTSGCCTLSSIRTRCGSSGLRWKNFMAVLDSLFFTC